MSQFTTPIMQSLATSPQWFLCIINSLLLGMQVALKCFPSPCFSFFCLKVTETQQLFHLRNGAFQVGLS